MEIRQKTLHDKPVFRVNLKEILRSKAPGMYKTIPGFVVGGLSRLICEKELNVHFAQNVGLTGVAFMQNTLRNFDISIHLHGTEHLPEAGRRCIFASNHPLGGLDGIALSAVLGEKYKGNIRYLVNDILYYIEPLQDIFVPINKHGAQAKDAVKILNEAFVSDNQIITFPAGLCSRKNKGVIRDPEWKKMFITKAVEYRRDVVPIYFEARNSDLFYQIANIRKQFGLKFNAEMLLLPSEMMKAQHSVFNIYFDKAVSWHTFNASKTPAQWAKEMENRVYAMKP